MKKASMVLILVLTALLSIHIDSSVPCQDNDLLIKTGTSIVYRKWEDPAHMPAGWGEEVGPDFRKNLEDAIAAWKSANRKIGFDDAGNIWFEYISPAYLARTFSIQDESGYMIDAYVRINTYYDWAATCEVADDAYDLETTLIHELGHVIGLKQAPPDCTPSQTVMVRGQSKDDCMHKIGPLDRSALSILHPSGKGYDQGSICWCVCIGFFQETLDYGDGPPHKGWFSPGIEPESVMGDLLYFRDSFMKSTDEGTTLAGLMDEYASEISTIMMEDERLRQLGARMLLKYAGKIRRTAESGLDWVPADTALSAVLEVLEGIESKASAPLSKELRKVSMALSDSRGKGFLAIYRDVLRAFEREPVELENTPSIPVLYPCVPNPFSEFIEISYFLPEDGETRIEIYDAQGKLIESIVDGREGPGYHTIRWHPRTLGTGVYFLRFTADRLVKTRKLVLVK